MKYILKTEKIVIPKGVTVTSKARVVTVKGPKGTLTKSFKHIKAEIIVKKEQDEHTKENQDVVRNDAFILAGHDPKRIGIGTGTDAHGLHLLCYVFAEIEMTSVGYAIGIYG